MAVVCACESTQVVAQDGSSRADQSSSERIEIPSTPAGKMLGEWLRAHNLANSDSISAWIHQSFSSDKLATMNFDNHLDFYMTGTEMFGQLHEQPYRIIKSEPYALTIYLVEEGYQSQPEPDPLHILIVELELDPEDPEHLKKGLGLGNLVCAIEYGRDDLLEE